MPGVTHYDPQRKLELLSFTFFIHNCIMFSYFFEYYNDHYVTSHYLIDEIYTANICVVLSHTMWLLFRLHLDCLFTVEGGERMYILFVLILGDQNVTIVG